MKKLLSLGMAGLILVGMTGSALAAEITGTDSAKIKVKELPGFQQLLQLREEGKATREQMKADRQEIKNLVQEARQDKNKEALSNLKEFRPSIKQLREELRELRTTQKNNWQTLREARRANDQVQVENALNQIITTRQSLNEKLAEIKDAEDQAIQILQETPETPSQQ